TLAGVAREARARRQSQGSALVLTGSSPAVGEELQYRTAISALLAQDAFANLDAAADSARRSKQRLEGGVWQLYVFYDTVANPAAGQRASSAEWDQHVAKLQSWIAARPQSVTPRIALAE